MKRLAPLLLAASCTSTQALRLPADEAQLKYVNETVRDQPAKLKLKENKTFAVFSLSLDETTARYKDAEGGEHSVALDYVVRSNISLQGIHGGRARAMAV